MFWASVSQVSSPRLLLSRILAAERAPQGDDMSDARHRDRRNATYSGWLVALGVVVFSIVGLAVWDYNTEPIPTIQTPPAQ